MTYSITIIVPEVVAVRFVLRSSARSEIERSTGSTQNSSVFFAEKVEQYLSTSQERIYEAVVIWMHTPHATIASNVAREVSHGNLTSDPEVTLSL